jgi:trehalose 6-phosphate phosphatase
MAGHPVTPALPTGRLALFLDVDGTLIDIAPRPDLVIVPEPLIHALATLEARLEGALALVSGRAIADLDVLFDPLRLRASGVHGAEVRLVPDGPVLGRGADRLADTLVQAVERIASGHDGTLTENKGFSVALHYRANPTAGPALQHALEALVAATDPDLQILPGHMVFEVKRSAFNKGSAIADFLRQSPFKERRPVFIGDDVTDLPGFATVLAADGLAFSVQTRRPDVSGHFEAPGEVRAWIEALAGSHS